MDLFTLSFIHSSTHFTLSLFRSFIHSFTHSLAYLLINSLIISSTHSLIHLITHLLFIYSVSQLFTCSHPHLLTPIHLFTYWLIDWFIHLLNHYFIFSFIHSSTHFIHSFTHHRQMDILCLEKYQQCLRPLYRKMCEITGLFCLLREKISD